MPTKFRIFAIATALAAGTSGAAMAQYACPPGYTYYNGACQPAPAPGYSNPVSGAASGGAAGAGGCPRPTAPAPGAPRGLVPASPHQQPATPSDSSAS